ncbi:MAG: hypothetical protein MMC33_004853 [Icmadophila ericetorum]|nr:hypothetical protein [Icmadophila ericetorum]
MLEYIEIDPDGDVILILASLEDEEDPNRLDQDAWLLEKEENEEDSTENTRKKQCPTCLQSFSSNSAYRIHICRAARDLDDASNESIFTCIKCLEDFDYAEDLHEHGFTNCLGASQEEVPTPIEPELSSGELEIAREPERQATRVRVSSKHLSLSSSAFKALFSRKFREGTALHNEGSIELSLPDDHPATLLILLNIVHGKFKKVPKALDLDMLTQMAILVDKYDLSEAVSLVSDIWISDINETIPTHMSEALVQWICISWIFKRRFEFKKATRVAQNYAESTIDKYSATSLPIPSVVINAIESTREKAISEITSLLHGYLVTYRDSKVDQCSFQCDSLVLGSITKNLQSLSLLNSPGPPYEGHSFNYLQREIARQEYPTLCNKTGSRRSNINDCRSVKMAIVKTVERLAGGLQGLNFGDCGRFVLS